MTVRDWHIWLFIKLLFISADVHQTDLSNETGHLFNQATLNRNKKQHSLVSDMTFYSFSLDLCLMFVTISGYGTVWVCGSVSDVKTVNTEAAD